MGNSFELINGKQNDVVRLGICIGTYVRQIAFVRSSFVVTKQCGLLFNHFLKTHVLFNSNHPENNNNYL